MFIQEEFLLFSSCKRIKRNCMHRFLLLQSEGHAAIQESGKIHLVFVFARLLQLRDASVGHLVFTEYYNIPIAGSNGMIAII